MKSINHYLIVVTALSICSLGLAHNPNESKDADHDKGTAATTKAGGHGAGDTVSCPAPDPKRPVTYYKDILPMMQKLCLDCHQEGGVGGISFASLEETRDNAKEILSYIKKGKMPHGASLRPNPECGGTERFKGPRFCTKTEMCAVKNWVETKMQEGDKPKEGTVAKKSESTTAAGEWQLGEPDLVFGIGDRKQKGPANSKCDGQSSYVVPPNEPGKDNFRAFELPFDSNVDRYLTQFEIKPGAADGETDGLSRVVHHIHLYLDYSGVNIPKYKEELKEKVAKGLLPKSVLEGDAPGFTMKANPEGTQLIAGWFPGSEPMRLPEGIAQKVPKGAKLVLQVHYTNTTGHAVRDCTKIGIHFARTPVRKLRTVITDNDKTLNIPAGAVHHPEPDEVTTKEDLVMESILPHAHQLGTDVRFEVQRPGEKKAECLMDVKWDFDHQNLIDFAKPMFIPKGSTLRQICYYDNTREKRKPLAKEGMPADPVAVHFGPEATNEMCRTEYIFTRPQAKFQASSPKLGQASVDGSGVKVSGEGVMPGALLRVGDKLLMDTVVGPDGSLTSKSWRTAIAMGQKTAMVSIVNPDGGNTTPVEVQLP